MTYGSATGDENRRCCRFQANVAGGPCGELADPAAQQNELTAAVECSNTLLSTSTRQRRVCWSLYQ